MEKSKQAIEDRISEIKALGSVSSDKLGEFVLLEGEIRKVFVEAVSEGLHINEKVSEYYLNMGRHLAQHKPKLKEHRVYGAACQELGLKKSTANNILKLYEIFGDRVRDMISLIPVRKLLVICAHIDLKRDALIMYCQDHSAEIRKYEGADLRAWVKGEPLPGPKPREQRTVGSFIIKKSPSRKTIIIELNESDANLQASLSDYLCECIEKFEPGKKNLQLVGEREVKTASAQDEITQLEVSESHKTATEAELAPTTESPAGQGDSTLARVVPFPKKSLGILTSQEQRN